MEYMERIRRYFLVIRELHEMGYELIRVCPCVSPNGMNWRCATTVKKYTLKNCGAIYRGQSIPLPIHPEVFLVGVTAMA